jgi:S-adenosylmethionine hydrolase
MGRVIALLTDFGRRDAYAGVLHGVILGIAPYATVVELCHEVPPQDVQAGAFLLLTSYAYFPRGTIHLAIVDPGVGTARKIVAATAGGYTFVGPDNGLLRWALDRAGSAGAASAASADSVSGSA